MRSVEKAPAKINLGLDTPYNHRDGLQEWNMVMTSIDLADYVEVTTLPDENRIHVTSDSGFFCQMINAIWRTKRPGFSKNALVLTRALISSFISTSRLLRVLAVVPPMRLPFYGPQQNLGT